MPVCMVCEWPPFSHFTNTGSHHQVVFSFWLLWLIWRMTILLYSLRCVYILFASLLWHFSVGLLVFHSCNWVFHRWIWDCCLHPIIFYCVWIVLLLPSLSSLCSLLGRPMNQRSETRYWGKEYSFIQKASWPRKWRANHKNNHIMGVWMPGSFIGQRCGEVKKQSKKVINLASVS